MLNTSNLQNLHNPHTIDDNFPLISQKLRKTIIIPIPNRNQCIIIILIYKRIQKFQRLLLLFQKNKITPKITSKRKITHPLQQGGNNTLKKHENTLLIVLNIGIVFQKLV